MAKEKKIIFGEKKMNIHSDEIEFLKLTDNERNNYLEDKEDEL